MLWIQITEADVKTTLGEYEWALLEAARAPGASDQLSTCINRAVLMVRGYVESSPISATVGPEGYVPAVLWNATLAILTQIICSTLNVSGITLNDDRREAFRQAMKQLDKVAAGEIRITGPGESQPIPDDAITTDVGGYGGTDPVDFAGTR